MSSTAKKLAKGSFLRMLEFFSTAIIGLVMMPFVIHSLGDNMYGLWIFVGTFIGYYGLLDLGLNSAVERYMSKAIGNREDDQVNAILNTSLVIFAIIGVIALCVSFLIAFVVPLLMRNINNEVMFRKVVVILGFNFALSFPFRVFSAVLSSNVRHDLLTIVEISKLVIRTLFVIIFLKLGYSVVALALITLLVNLTGYLAIFLIAIKCFPYIKISVKNFNKHKVLQLFSYSVYTFIGKIADQMRFNIDNIVIGAFMGLSYVTLYSIAARLIIYFRQLMIAAVGMLTPVFSQYEAKGDYAAIREKFMFVSKISGYLSFLIGGLLIIFGKLFIQRWMGEKYLDTYLILLVLVIPTVISLTQSPSIQLLYGISKHKFFTFANAIEGSSNLIISIILVKKMGLIGVALGTAIPMLVLKVFIQPIYVCKVIKLPVITYLMTMIRVVFVSVFFLFSYWVLVKNYLCSQYLNLLFFALLGMIYFSIFTFIIGFSKTERLKLKSVICHSRFRK